MDEVRMNTLKDSKEELRKRVPDFALKVQHIYQLLNWEWVRGDKLTIPTVEMIRKNLYSSIDRIEGKTVSTSSGGLTVYLDKDDGTMGMEFTVSETICF